MSSESLTYECSGDYYSDIETILRNNGNSTEDVILPAENYKKPLVEFLKLSMNHTIIVDEFKKIKKKDESWSAIEKLFEKALQLLEEINVNLSIPLYGKNFYVGIFKEYTGNQLLHLMNTFLKTRNKDVENILKKYEKKDDEDDEDVIRFDIEDYRSLINYIELNGIDDIKFSVFKAPKYAFYRQVLYMDTLKAEKKAFRSYQITSSPFNEPLREEKKINATIMRDINRMDEIFTKIPPVEFNFVCYRGTSFNFIEDAEVGDIVEDKGFVSTSLNEHVTTKFIDAEQNCCHYVIYIPANSRVVPLWNINFIDGVEKSSYYRYHLQDEILLPRNSKFKYLGQVKSNYTSKCEFLDEDDDSDEDEKHTEFDIESYVLEYIQPIENSVISSSLSSLIKRKAPEDINVTEQIKKQKTFDSGCRKRTKIRRRRSNSQTRRCKTKTKTRRSSSQTRRCKLKTRRSRSSSQTRRRKTKTKTRRSSSKTPKCKTKTKTRRSSKNTQKSKSQTRKSRKETQKQSQTRKHKNKT